MVSDMGRYAVIENGVVTNLAAADAEFAAEHGWIEATPGVRIGWTHDGQAFSEASPVVPVPVSVTPRQAKLALLGAGLLSNVDAALAAIPDATARAAAQIEWEYASEFLRTAPLIATMGAALGLTSEQIDDLFRGAATL